MPDAAAHKALHQRQEALHLRRGDSIVTAYAEMASGPGWRNAPLWVIVRGADGTLREECLQPHEQPSKVLTLYETAAALQRALIGGLNAK